MRAKTQSASSKGDAYVVGVDYGTLSGRAVVVRVAGGAELGSAVCQYRHGVMDAVLHPTGQRLAHDWALQMPSDYFTACTMLPTEGVYQPDPSRAECYDTLYHEYRKLHEYFGRGDNDVLRRLKRIRREAVGT